MSGTQDGAHNYLWGKSHGSSFRLLEERVQVGPCLTPGHTTRIGRFLQMKQKKSPTPRNRMSGTQDGVGKQEIEEQGHDDQGPPRAPA